MTPDPIFEVIVVGTGPSGGIAAYELAKHGVSVLVLEKERLPRYKPCGGGVTTKALRLLDFDISPVVEREINAATICFARSQQIHVDGHEIGKMVMRSAFDELIATRAVQQGATLVDECPVTHVSADSSGCIVRTAQGEFRSRVLIGADGANSVVAKAVTREPTATGVAIEAEIDVATTSVNTQRVVFDFGTIANGYGYIFPKARHLSVGVYSTDARVPDLRKTLDRYLVRANVPRIERIRSIVGHKVPLGRVRRAQAGRILLVGDAAGTADPLWGEGIYYGLRSGRLAADAILRALGSGTLDPERLSSYAPSLHQHVGRDLMWARRVAALFYTLPEIVLVGLVREERLAQEMMGVLRGDRRYLDYLRRVVVRFPSLVAHVFQASF